jgi:hypothetical protein
MKLLNTLNTKLKIAVGLRTHPCVLQTISKRQNPLVAGLSEIKNQNNHEK